MIVYDENCLVNTDYIRKIGEVITISSRDTGDVINVVLNFYNEEKCTTFFEAMKQAFKEDGEIDVEQIRDRLGLEKGVVDIDYYNDSEDD